MVAQPVTVEGPPLRATFSAELRQAGRKVSRAWRDGTLATKVRRQAGNVIYVPVASAVADHRLSPSDRSLDLTTGFRDHRGGPYELRCSDAGLRRLVAAFAAAQESRTQCPPELEVRGLWAEWLHLHYQGLRRSLVEADVSGLRELLENLHRDSLSTGVGGTIDDLNRTGGRFVGPYYRALWCRYRDLLEGLRPQWDDVSSPVVGNPAGAWVGNRLVQVETLRHAHHATMLLQLLEVADGRRILEIGGGLGGQAYQCLALAAGQLEQYTILDLPEVACLASYCLMAAIGEDKVRLLGEEPPAGPSPHVEVLPHWWITRHESGDADVVYNAHSFSEMDGRSATFYLSEVERISPRYFFHVNHETRFRYRTEGGLSLNRIGSEMVPSRGHFRLVDKRPQAFVRPENRGNRGYAYLYERTDGTPCAAEHPAPKRSGPTQAGKSQRILLLSSSADRYGSDRAMSELAAALARSGHTVAAGIPHDGPLVDVLRAMGIPVMVAPLSVIDRSSALPRLPSLVAAAVRASNDLVHLFHGFSPDVVYSNTSHVVDGPALARALGAAHVWHLREIERVPRLARHLYGYWLRATSARVITISEAVRRAYFARRSDRIVVVPDGVELATFRAGNTDRAPSTYDDERPLRVLSVGRITPWKGQDVAVNAVLSLARAGRPVRLRVVGAALTERDEAFETRLRALSSTCAGVSIEGEVDDVRPLYEWSDVVVHTAVEPEPFGRVIVEALASGCAVVATDHGGPREIIRDAVDGRLVEPGDPDRLAACLETFLADPGEVVRLGRAARTRADSFSMEATARAVDDVLHELDGERLTTEAR